MWLQSKTKVHIYKNSYKLKKNVSTIKNVVFFKNYYSLNLNQSNFHWLNQWFAPFHWFINENNIFNVKSVNFHWLISEDKIFSTVESVIFHWSNQWNLTDSQ